MGWRWCKLSAGGCRTKLGTKCRQDLWLEQRLHHKPTEPETVLGMHHHVVTAPPVIPRALPSLTGVARWLEPAQRDAAVI